MLPLVPVLHLHTLAAVAVPADHHHNARVPGSASAATSSCSAVNGPAAIGAAPLAQAIAAMGGKDAINKLQGISSHVKYVLHAFLNMIIAVPG
jgi:hypothetical protein